MLKDIQSPAGDVSQENSMVNAVRPCVTDPAGLPRLMVIPSVFNNVLFRSRLEARWAVFLTELGIDWEYEFEGYNLNGIWYLPDFYLPNWCGGTFIEVKPKKFNQIEDNKVRDLCLLTGKRVLKAIGSPSLVFYEIYFPEWYQQFFEIDVYYTNFSLHWKADREQRFWVEPSPYEYEIEPKYFPELTNAVRIAKSYRF